MEILNPFSDSGIVNYEQYKKYPLILFGVQEKMNLHVEQQVLHIENKYFFGDRFILIGERGAGKTSTLFFIKDALEDKGVMVFYITRLIQDFEHFELITRERLSEASKEPIYILVDFPDTIDTHVFKSFLDFLWKAISHQNQDKINFIFAMNHSHYDKSFSYSEIFGKFITIRFDRLTNKESKQLIQSRLTKVEKDIDEVFSESSLDHIHKITKGIPRNLISACYLLYINYNGRKIDESTTGDLFKETLYGQIIKDRVDNHMERIEYNQIIEIIKTDFGGVVNSKIDLISKINEKVGLGRKTATNKLKQLELFGILSIRKGGYNRLNRIISLE